MKKTAQELAWKEKRTYIAPSVIYKEIIKTINQNNMQTEKVKAKKAAELLTVKAVPIVHKDVRGNEKLYIVLKNALEQEYVINVGEKTHKACIELELGVYGK